MGKPNLVTVGRTLNDLRRAVQKLASLRLNADSSPTFGSLTLENLTASRLTYSDADKLLSSVADLTAWIAGTANQVIVTDDSDGSITLSTPQDIHTGATPTFEDMVLTGLSGSIISTSNVETSIEELDAALTITNEPTGFPNRTDSDISWLDPGTARTFRIAPSGSTFDVWQKGVKSIISGNDDIQISDASGTHVIYYNAGSLAEAVNPSHATFDDIIVNKVLVAIVYWNTNAGSDDAYILADERHGAVMSGKTHEYLHDLIGANYRTGLTASGYTLNTKSDAALKFDVTDGEFYDEDLEVEITDGVAANQYEQVLTGDAEIPVLFRDDVDGSWTEQAASTLPYKNNGDNTNLNYNNDDGDDTWSQVAATNNRYIIYTLVATNDWLYPMKMIQGNAEYITKNAAMDGAADEIVAWGDLPSPEFVILYRFILQTGVFAGVKNAQIVEVIDLRASQLSGTSATSQDHGALTGLSDDDHIQYILHSLADAANDFLVASGADTYVKKTLAETGAILEGDIEHDNLQSIPASEHVDHGLILDSNLKVWLRDRASGGNPIDEVGTETWTAEGDAAQVDMGVIGKAWTFDGTGDYLDVASPSGMPTGTTARTICFWMKTTTNRVEIMFSYGENAAGKLWEMHVRPDIDNHLMVFVVGGNIQGTAVLNDGIWHHVAAVLPSGATDVNEIILYVDGEIDVISSSGVETLQTTQVDFHIGKPIFPANNNFTGEMDDVRTYDRELSATEIKEIYQLGTLDAMTELDVAYFKSLVSSRHLHAKNLNVIEGEITTCTINDLTTVNGVVTDLQVTGNNDLTVAETFLKRYELDFTGSDPDDDGRLQENELALIYDTNAAVLYLVANDEDQGYVGVAFDNAWP